MDSLPLINKPALSQLMRATTQPSHVLGTSSLTAVAWWLSQPEIRYASQLPHLLLFSKSEEFSQFETAMSFFAPRTELLALPAFDVSPYSNLYPSSKLIAERIRWLHRAQSAQAGEIFMATVPALLQRTLPFDVLAKSSVHLHVQNELPQGFTRQLDLLGYIPAPVVEDVGTYAFRGGILDIFSPAHKMPIRLELFGDIIESIRFFDPETQRSLEPTPKASVLPAREVLFLDENRQSAVLAFNKSLVGRNVDSDDLQTLQLSLSQGQFVHGFEFLVPYFYPQPALPSDHFCGEVQLWTVDPLEIDRQTDAFISGLKYEFEDSPALALRPHYQEVYATPNSNYLPAGPCLKVSKILIQESVAPESSSTLQFSTSEPTELIQKVKALSTDTKALVDYLQEALLHWRHEGYKIFVACTTTSQAQRMRLMFERAAIKTVLRDASEFAWAEDSDNQTADSSLIHLIIRPLPESLRCLQEKVIFLREEDLLGRKAVRRANKTSGTITQRANALSFGDLKVNDFVVHKLHGVGVYEGLKVMPIQGIEAEFIQLRYKDNDKLYLPVYRVAQIQKYSGPNAHVNVDKLGGTGWEKTKTKVRNHLRDLASELLQLYAQRAQIERPAFSGTDDVDSAFEFAFQYDETEDQLRAIRDVFSDLSNTKPMDRLICGDVGFGKTEVAMRAAFHVAKEKKQVAVIAPTTILTFQHYESFKKRFSKWPIEIRALNRFVAKPDVKKTLQDLKAGAVDVVIGTHRLLSKDVEFKNLGLLIVDEEQKFGVLHKERLRKLKANVDTMAMSATPIPRTLNMSLMGLRDLSIINTPPVDRLPTRTFVTRFESETIRKAVYAEIARGGQIYFIHNRIHSIYELVGRLRELLPDVRIKIAHGQMEEEELESVTVAFFNHEIDMLVCTAIVESGMDIPRANTMFIDNAHEFGLSQLYQLRGRVGRSKERAYCYLLIPQHKKIDKVAQERLKVLQENTALGSGFKIAHYDLELRGAGNMLGEEQSGHVGAVGYELYLELLEEAVQSVKGIELEVDIEPDMNVRIPALIPDNYIPDIRVRLSYYKSLTEITGPEDIDRIEEELRDQFGKPPEVVLNLLGLMSIRKLCKDLGVKDLSSGTKSISLGFTPHTKLPTTTVVDLASRQNKKYSVTPDHRLNIRINELTWPRIYDELIYLKGLC